jgi:beta-lactamase class A
MSNINELNKSLNEICESQHFNVKWYFKDLKTGESLDRNGDEIGPSASTRKISILMAAMKAIHEGKIALLDEIIPEEKYFGTNSGCFQHFLPGFKVKFQDLLTMMIIVSDNVSTGTVTEMLTLDYINDFCKDIGMNRTNHRVGFPTGADLTSDLNKVNSTTPNDVGLLLEIIHNSTSDQGAANELGSTMELCNIAMEILLSQKLNNRLPLKLASPSAAGPKDNDVKVAHKTGSYQTGYSDSGIIYPSNHPGVILCTYTDDVPQYLTNGDAGIYAANNAMGSLALECYKYTQN